MSQASLAQAIGASTASVFRYEKGTTSPSAGTLAQLATVLGLSADRLLDDRELSGIPAKRSPAADVQRIRRLVLLAKRLDARSLGSLLSMAEVLARKTR